MQTEYSNVIFVMTSTQICNLGHRNVRQLVQKMWSINWGNNCTTLNTG